VVVSARFSTSFRVFPILLALAAALCFPTLPSSSARATDARSAATISFAGQKAYPVGTYEGLAEWAYKVGDVSLAAFDEEYWKPGRAWGLAFPAGGDIRQRVWLPTLSPYSVSLAPDGRIVVSILLAASHASLPNGSRAFDITLVAPALKGGKSATVSLVYLREMPGDRPESKPKLVWVTIPGSESVNTTAPGPAAAAKAAEKEN
jgi:hypothetical protein